MARQRGRDGEEAVRGRDRLIDGTQSGDDDRNDASKLDAANIVTDSTDLAEDRTEAGPGLGTASAIRISDINGEEPDVDPELGAPFANPADMGDQG